MFLELDDQGRCWKDYHKLSERLKPAYKNVFLEELMQTPNFYFVRRISYDDGVAHMVE